MLEIAILSWVLTTLMLVVGAVLVVRYQSLAKQCDRLRAEYALGWQSNEGLARELTAVREEEAVASAEREEQRRELAVLREEVARRPRIQQQTYRIVALGMPKSGKTTLLLRWANPLWNPSTVAGTEFEKFRRTVSSSLLVDDNVLVNHVFELWDFGGERLVDAHDTMMSEDIHGVLVVVDLARDGDAMDEARIQQQVVHFDTNVLRFFLQSPRITRTCKALVLFINKSDTIPGRPQEVEELAMERYQPLIDQLRSFSANVHIRVLVGSALSGHNTHLLISHFIERLLPRDAYDPQLLQRQVAQGAGDQANRTRG